MDSDEIRLANWMPVKDYAIRQGVTIHAIYKAIERGKLRTKKLGNLTLVYVED